MQMHDMTDFIYFRVTYISLVIDCSACAVVSRSFRKERDNYDIFTLSKPHAGPLEVIWFVTKYKGEALYYSQPNVRNKAQRSGTPSGQFHT